MRLEELYPLLNQVSIIYITNDNGYCLYSGRFMRTKEQERKIRKYFLCEISRINAIANGIEIVIVED